MFFLSIARKLFAVSLIFLVVVAGTAQTSPSSDLPSFWKLGQEQRDAGNPLKKYAEILRLEERFLADSQMKRVFPELKAMLEEELGDPSAHWRGIEYMRGGAGKEKPLPDNAPFDGYQPQAAVEVIVAAASGRQVIMIGEEHHVPQTRSILKPLLKALHQKGYRYFAAETFNQKVGDSPDGKYPTAATGTYTNDPVFADGVREAMKLGYTLIPYEFDFTKLPSNAAQIERDGFREKEQANNLKERIFSKNPQAKVLVWAGRAHVSKSTLTNGNEQLKMMAQHFQEMTGIEPFSVYAARFYEAGKPAYEDPLYRYATAKGLIARPTIFVSKEGKTWSRGGGIDAEVFFPRVKWIEGRPDWYARDLARQPYHLPKELQLGDGLRLVQAHYLDEPDRALPVDQMVWRVQEKCPVLMLPVGHFRVRVIDPDGKVLASTQVQIGQDSSPDRDKLKELRSLAQKVVEQLARGQFDEVAAAFDQRFNQSMPVEKLKREWQALCKRSGEFRGIEVVRPEFRGTGDYLMMTCKFAQGKEDLRFLFTEKKRIAGLRFLPTALQGTGLIRATSSAMVRPAHEGDLGVITFPVPGTYRDQVPLEFQVQSVPAAALKEYRLVSRGDGLNWLCEARVAPPAEGAIVSWHALVLVRDRPPEPLPQAPHPDVPESVKPWLKNTSCVQSQNAAIRAKASELAKNSSHVETYARSVIEFTSKNPVNEKSFWTLDALSALSCGGSCTSRANLAAALLRAQGIPARTVAHLPTWSGPLYEHWLVEYWHPGKGWIWLESSLNQFQPAASTVVVLNVATPEDENHPNSFLPARVRGVVPGAPYLSVQEISPELLPAFDLQKQDTVTSLAKPEVTLRGSPEELQQLFHSAAKSYSRKLGIWRSHAFRPDRLEDLVLAARQGGASRMLELFSD